MFIRLQTFVISLATISKRYKRTCI